MNFLAKMLANLEEYPDKEFLVEVHGNKLKPKKSSEILDIFARVRGYLRDTGVKAGDRVALLSPNSSAWLAIDLGIISENAICVPMYYRQEPRQLVGMLEDCCPSLLIVQDVELGKKISEVWDKPCNIASYEDIFQHPPTRDLPPTLSPENPITIIYTSGTSGEPKGVTLNAINADFILERVVKEIEKKTGDRNGDDRVFHYLPFCFAGSRIVLWSQIYRGNPLMISTDLNNLVEEISTANPHFFLNVPALLERMKTSVNQRLEKRGKIVQKLYHEAIFAYERNQNGQSNVLATLLLLVAKQILFNKIKNAIGTNLEFLICGSAPLSEETQRWFEMIGIPVYQVYGLTETAGIISIDNPGTIKPGRVGCPVDGCQVRISQQGELICRGPNVFIGYWNREEATKEVFQDGWFHTGDRAEIDEDGSIKILGRLKNIIVPESGHNIAPEPLEELLINADNQIEQAIILGHGRPYLTAIVTGSTNDLDVEKVLEKVNSELPHYQRIRKVYCAPELFSTQNDLLTAMQKLRRKAIETYYQQEIQNLYQ